MTQVAIVGGGPVGLGLAIDLGQRGIDVVVLERYHDLHLIPKGQNLTQRTAEHFRAWGVLEAVEEARPIPASFGTAGMTAYKTFTSGYSYDWLARSDVQAFYSERNIRIPQYEVERALRGRVAELPSVELRFNSKVTALANIEGRPQLTVTPAEGDPYVLEADYVVGCDGARSRVRDAAGITQSFRSYKRRMILSVFRSDELQEIMSRFPGKSYFNALHPDFEGYWQFLGRVDMQSWFFHAPVPDDTTLDTVDLGSRLARAVGREIAFETQYLGFWDLRIAIADSFRSGNVFIAGDAAHSHPPYGGYGVNTGFEDARNLSWKIAAMYEGWGTQALLDSYSAERQPVFCSTSDDFIARMIEEDHDFLEKFDPDQDKAAFEAEWATRAQSTKKDVEQFCPNYMGSPIVPGTRGTPSAVGSHEHRARPGFLLPPKEDVARRWGTGFALVTVGPGGAFAEGAAAAAKAKGLSLTHVEMPATEDTAMWQASVILLRPDRFVAYAGDGSDTTPEALIAAAAAF